MELRRGSMSDAESLIIPPPTMGWNTKDPVSNMDQSYALEMLNFFPGSGTVDLRKGSSLHINNKIGNGKFIGHLAEYNQNSGTSFLLAFVSSGGKVYNCSVAGTATDISGAAVFPDLVFTVNFQNKIFIKGYDSTRDVQVWNGTGNVAAAGFTGPSGDDKALWKMTTYKNRLYFLGYQDGSIWYGDVNAITGALVQFDVSSLLTRGGEILHIDTYSGNYYQQQDIFVIVSSEGEVLLYQGDYPGSTTWSQIGHLFIAAPAGKKSFFKWGNDLTILTNEGMISLSSILGSNLEGDYTYATDKIASAYKEAIASSLEAGLSNNISGVHYPNGPYISILFPFSVVFVMNTITKAWAKFTYIADYFGSQALFNNDLYMSGYGSAFNDLIRKVNTGTYDDDTENPGTALTRQIKLRPAYNYFKDPYKNKQFTEAIPYIYMDQGLTLTMDSDVDFANVAATNTETDTSDTSYKLYTPTMGLSGIGITASLRIDQTVTDKQMSLQAIKVKWIQATI